MSTSAAAQTRLAPATLRCFESCARAGRRRSARLDERHHRRSAQGRGPARALDPQAAFDPQIGRWFLSAGIGPTFRDLNLTLTSNQSFFGGGIPSISDSTWQVGLGLSPGLSTIVCPDCIAGNPLKVGVEGRARFFPSQSISLRSPRSGSWSREAQAGLPTTAPSSRSECRSLPSNQNRPRAVGSFAIMKNRRLAPSDGRNNTNRPKS